MLRYIKTTLSLAVLRGIACEFDMEMPNLVIEYDDRPSREPEIVAVYVAKDGAKNPLPVWLIEAMGEDLMDLCRRHAETPRGTVAQALRDSVEIADDYAEVVARLDLPVRNELPLKAAAE